ncbi:hypothetical protein [Streptomyces sp. TLI_171]|uniref:hypothetical protein n=1 Tax=Streptomyces sp. TLI_171 TaxID=1938859 RepID=UPI000C601B68|nr:hypothetical protein [Streptomyces sp. TLI_171]RKE22712.1 hypothetical protein BX266_6164 [Streptomyces sp. TLI_171]
MMERSVEELTVPVAVIVAESGRRGRRRQLLRRLRIAGTALTVAGLAAAGAGVGLPMTGAGHAPARTVGPAAIGPSAPDADHTDTPSPAPSTTPSSAPSPVLPMGAGPELTSGWPDGKPTGYLMEFTPLQVYQTLGAMLPGRTFKLGFGSGYPPVSPDNGSSVDLRYTDDEATSAIVMTMSRPMLPFPTDGRAPAVPPFRCGTPSGHTGNHQEACFAGYLPDGSWELVELDDSRLPGLYGYRVALWRPDGLVLDFTEFVGVPDSDGAGHEITRENPPLDLTTWRAVVESSDWSYFEPAR